MRGQGVGFVPDVNQGRGGRVSGDALGDACVFGCVGCIGLARGVVQQQHGIGLADVLPGAGDADALGFVAAVAQACCVEHVQGHAFDLDGLLDDVARGAGLRGDDGQFRPGQGVEQGAFAGVGLSGNDDFDAFAQQRALLGAGEHIMKLLAQGGELAAGAGLGEEVDFFFREVQRGFGEHAQLDQPLQQGLDARGEGACQ